MPKGTRKKQVRPGGVKKTLLKKKSQGAPKDDSRMDDGSQTAPRETAHELFKRHAAERKQVLREVKELKRQRQKLSKKSSKDAKKAISQKIEKMLEEQKKRHEDELAKAGVDKASRPPCASSDEEGGASDDDADI
mmetsp:Transcript_86925/g.243602  ORF Transcript_86925/g.243602 Transcript_86925/m.243602 type:complete len:135 (-) Transcript_86925:86-490(-)|eukprot:CAMPEP_0117537904 /NCGR_PEP_ID=MMETSP0784-20121206/42207_1 /TAXON_ID=39447 /ORGANISM="" /LENGTH=134 /DNA_ID=CAMNT_0005334509 /DNA_START=127 /DNA_END=531 /DNA_ORIENTATION=+